MLIIVFGSTALPAVSFCCWLTTPRVRDIGVAWLGCGVAIDCCEAAEGWLIEEGKEEAGMLLRLAARLSLPFTAGVWTMGAGTDAPIPA